MSRVSYTRESIDRALTHHVAHGRIKAWRGLGNGRYLIELPGAEPLEVRTLREAWIFIAGVMSAKDVCRHDADATGPAV